MQKITTTRLGFVLVSQKKLCKGQLSHELSKGYNLGSAAGVLRSAKQLAASGSNHRRV